MLPNKLSNSGAIKGAGSATAFPSPPDDTEREACFIVRNNELGPPHSATVPSRVALRERAGLTHTAPSVPCKPPDRSGSWFSQRG